jgi:hypothetical protein
MIIDNMSDRAQDFTDRLGGALNQFLKDRGLSESEASREMQFDRGALNTYTAGVNGRRRRPPAELLARACLLGFEFEFEGYLIVALKDGQRIVLEDRQLHLEFTREFDLANNGDTVSGLKRPPGKVELTVSLRTVSSS